MEGISNVEHVRGTQVRTDRILPETRWLSAIIIPFLLAAFGVLYLLPEHTGELFAWNIQPRMTAMMLGEAYLAGACFFVRVVLSPRWHRVAVGFLPVTTFATLMGISTILHWDRFNHASGAFWTWVVLYFATPFLVPAVWWRNRKTDPGTLDTRDLLVPAWLRWVIGALGVGAVLIGLLFFLQPNFMIGAWPWKLTLLTARVMGTMFALAGAGAICIALDARWSAVRIAFQSQMIALVLVVLAIVFSWSDFRQANPLTRVFVAGMLFLLVASPLLYLWMERNSRVTVSAPEKYKPVPFIKGNPIFGNLLEFARDRLSVLQRMADRGDVVGMRFGRVPAILFNRPEDIQSILVEHADDFDKGDLIHHVFRPLIGDSIFSSEGDFHRQQRELMDPSFQPHTIANYVESAGFYGEQLQQAWAEGAIIDIHQQMASLSMSIFGKVLFDADVLSESDGLGAAIAMILEYPARALSRFLPIPYNWPVPLHRRTYKAVALIHSDFQRFIDERRAKPGERNDLLSLLLQARDASGQPMSDEQLMTECQSLFAAGYETMVTALTWSWYLLCQHPEIYTKLQQEVDSVLQGRTPTYADLVRLPSCLHVFKESMRIFPPAFAFFRQALRDVEIDGYLVPKDRLAFIVPYTLHRRPDYFPEPEKFDPERFTPEREKQLPRNAFLPFGAGSRICIGKHFALMEGPLLLATLAQRVTFRLLPGQQIVADPIRHLTLCPEGEVKVTVTRR